MASLPSFPTVKSDPWLKGLVRRGRGGARLWSGEFWKKITQTRLSGGKRAPFGGDVLRLISEENLRLYGRR